MKLERDLFVDYLRGLCIFMMIFVHFSSFLPFPIKPILSVGIDAVAEGFIFLAGMMVGLNSITKFMTDPLKTSKKFVIRSLELLIKNMLMIYTIWLPFGHILTPTKFHGLTDYIDFSIRVALLQEQPFALDILTIFAYLFLFTPVILYLIKKQLEWVVIVLSIILFIGGLLNPYILSIKPEETFPFSLWQVYFVGGVFFGKYYQIQNKNYGKINPNLIIVSVFFFISLLFRHFTGFLSDYFSIDFLKGIQFEKFPLNVYGFFYGLSVIFFIYQISLLLWPYLSKLWLINTFLVMYGKNSLRAFILHVYFDYIIRLIVKITNPPRYSIYIMILIDTIFIYLILKHWAKLKNLVKIKD